MSSDDPEDPTIMALRSVGESLRRAGAAFENAMTQMRGTMSRTVALVLPEPSDEAVEGGDTTWRGTWWHVTLHQDGRITHAAPPDGFGSEGDDDLTGFAAALLAAEQTRGRSRDGERG